MNTPEERRYTKEHEWAYVVNGRIRVGITQFAVDQLGDITLVELPKEGKSAQAGDAIAVIESVKSVSELYAPLNGTVVAVNGKLANSPELVNQSPYGDGWMIEIDGDAAQLEKLLTAKDYDALTADH